ncbi:unnamed protein product [Ectocarpus sp. 12 AP-2014]
MACSAWWWASCEAREGGLKHRKRSKRCLLFEPNTTVHGLRIRYSSSLMFVDKCTHNMGETEYHRLKLDESDPANNLAEDFWYNL